MLDTAMQRNPLKTDSMTTDNRPSPADSAKSQGGKFESMLAKQTQDTKAKTESKPDSPSSVTPKDKKQDKNDTRTQALQAKSGTPFEFKDDSGGESKIGLQEKISKNAKESTKPQDNPLAQILASSAQSTSEASSSKSDQKESKSNPAQTPLARTMPFPSPKDATQATQAQLDSRSGAKTLADVEAIARQKGLNPGKVSLETESAQDATRSAKAKGVPTSAKEVITYEYENNTDRIAIVQRGVKKPKNITSKISNEYPTKSAEEDSDGRASLKERPPLSGGRNS